MVNSAITVCNKFDIHTNSSYNVSMSVKDAPLKTPTILQKLAIDNGGIITTKSAEKAGISRAMLSYLEKKGSLERLSIGQYILPAEIPDEMYSLSQRSKNIVFSHESAMFLNGFSNRTPFEHSLTVPTNKQPSMDIKKKCKVYYIKSELFTIGLMQIKTPYGNFVPCYDSERTLCDIIRSRSRLDEETYLDGIKLYALNKNFRNLSNYAEAFGILKKVNTALEGLI